MGVYFVYRSHYLNPTTLHLQKFPQKNLLQFFQTIWQGIEDRDTAYEHAEKLLGRKVYSFDNLFTHIDEGDVSPPPDMAGVAEEVQEACYVNEMSFGEHYLQIHTDDDELEMALYFFDDSYAKKHPNRTAILLQEHWQFPGTFREGSFRPREKIQTLGSGTGKGTCYLVPLQYADSGNLTDLEFAAPRKWDKVRLPELLPLLVESTPDEEWPWEALVLRSQALKLPRKIEGTEKGFLTGLRDAPGNRPLWSVYSDWLSERGSRTAGLTLLEQALRSTTMYPLGVIYNTLSHKTLVAPVLEAEKALTMLSKQVKKPWGNNPKKSLIRVEEHIAQLCLHTDKWGRGEDLYHHWILFDDLWASANPALAHSLLRLGSRWNVLADDEG